MRRRGELVVRRESLQSAACARAAGPSHPCWPPDGRCEPSGAHPVRAMAAVEDRCGRVPGRPRGPLLATRRSRSTVGDKHYAASHPGRLGRRNYCHRHVGTCLWSAARPETIDAPYNLSTRRLTAPNHDTAAVSAFIEGRNKLLGHSDRVCTRPNCLCRWAAPRSVFSTPRGVSTHLGADRAHSPALGMRQSNFARERDVRINPGVLRTICATTRHLATRPL